MLGDNDFGVFFKAGVFAQPAVFELASGPRTVNGILDAAAFDRQSGATVIDGVQPTFTCPSSFARDIPRGTLLNLDSARWSVVNIDHDSTGIATIRLLREDDDATPGDQD